LLKFGQSVEIPGIQHQRFFADSVGLHSQGKPNIGVMQVIGGTNADKLHLLLFPQPAELFQMTVEPLKFDKKANVVEVAVQNPDRILGIDSRDQAISGLLYRFEMPRSDIPADPDNSKIPAHDKFLTGTGGAVSCVGE
jgi:hypothetical protein